MCTCTIYHYLWIEQSKTFKKRRSISIGWAWCVSWCKPHVSVFDSCGKKRSKTFKSSCYSCELLDLQCYHDYVYLIVDMLGQIMVASTTLMLFAGRFGLAPSANRKATAGLKLEVRDSGLQTGDPAGFTLADTLACGSVGHIIGVGVVLGLKNIGAL